MKKTFIAGAASGVATLALAVPMLIQVSAAATENDAGAMRSLRGPVTQEQVQQMIERDDAVLANIDAFAALMKQAIEAHRTALSAAATISDDTERQEAVKQAHEAMRATIKTAIEANPDLKMAMPMLHGRGKPRRFANDGGKHHGMRMRTKGAEETQP